MTTTSTSTSTTHVKRNSLLDFILPTQFTNSSDSTTTTGAGTGVESSITTTTTTTTTGPTPEDEKKYEEYKELEAQMRDTKVLLKTSRGKVAHLEQNVKSATEEKSKTENILIKQLQKEEAELLSQIQEIKESKTRLIRNVGVEMDRLRSIIRVLQEQIASIQSGIVPYHEGVLASTVTNYMQYNSNSANLQLLGLDNLMEWASNPEAGTTNNNKIRNLDTPNPDFLEAEADILIGNDNNTPGGPAAYYVEVEEKTKEKTKDEEESEDENQNENLLDPQTDNEATGAEDSNQGEEPFPHNDYSRIDFRTLEPGDGLHYPLPYSLVRFKYMGYIYHRDTDRWEQFTHSKIADHVYHTHLGASNQVPGLEEALLTMSEGEKAKVWVPSRLGYGVYGAGGLVPPNSDLIFIITLLAVDADEETNESSLRQSNENSLRQSKPRSDFYRAFNEGIDLDSYGSW